MTNKKTINVIVSDGNGGTTTQEKEIFGEVKLGDHFFYFTKNLVWNERSGLESFRYVLTCAKTTKKIPAKSGKTKPEALRNAIKEAGGTKEKLINKLNTYFQNDK